jgi:hypothetical protein
MSTDPDHFPYLKQAGHGASDVKLATQRAAPTDPAAPSADVAARRSAPAESATAPQL